VDALEIVEVIDLREVPFFGESKSSVKATPFRLFGALFPTVVFIIDVVNVELIEGTLLSPRLCCNDSIVLTDLDWSRNLRGGSYSSLTNG
jgi:hypothetical protein